MTVEYESQGNNKAPAILTTPDFFVRLQVDSTTQLSIKRYKGQTIEVNGERVAVGSSGFTLLNTANLISATGMDSGGAPAVTTLYYCYVSNSQASFAALGILLSATAPVLVNGVYYLGNSGNALNWRFVGWVYTISNGGTVNFEDSITNRLCVNYYNRRPSSIYLTPAYANASGFTNYNFAPSNYAKINGGTGDTGSYIANGEDNVDLQAVGTIASQVGVDSAIGIGDNTATSAVVAAVSKGNNDVPLSCRYNSTPSVGFRNVYLLMYNPGIGNDTVYSAGPRGGSAVSPALTYLTAVVQT